MKQKIEQNCTQIGHAGQEIFAICMNEMCEAKERILCVDCLNSIHGKCNNQFVKTEQFRKLLAEVKLKTQQETEHPVIQHLADLKSQSYRFIEILQLYAANVTINYDKTNRVNRVDQILNQQHLTTNDWNNGYKILTTQLAVPLQTTDDLIEQLDKVQKIIDQITLIQENQQINSRLVKSEWYNITPSKPLRVKVKDTIGAIALSPNGKYIASTGADKEIKIWDPITGKQVGNTFKGHTDWIQAIDYSKCGKYMVSCSVDRSIRQWNVSDQQQIGQSMLGHTKWIMGVQYSHDQRQIVSCSWDKTIRIWNRQTEKEDKRIEHNNMIYCQSLSPISNHVAFGDVKGTIMIYNYEKPQLSGHTLEGHTKRVWSIQYSANGKLIISGGDDQVVLIWNVRTRQKIASLFPSHKSQRLAGQIFSVFPVCFSPEMKHIISGPYDYIVRLWDRIRRKQINKPITFHNDDRIHTTQFSLDGSYIITGGDTQQIRIIARPC